MEINNFTFLNEPKEAFYLKIAKNGKDLGFPDLDDDLLVQELIQAVYESSGKAEPLTVKLFMNGNEYEVVWEFAFRKVTMDDTPFDWNVGNKLMQLIYSHDFDNAGPSKKARNHSISFESGNWFSLKDHELWDLLESIQTTTKNR